MQKEYDFIIVGAGLSGLVLAKDLSEKGKKVLILEKGGFLNRVGTVNRAFFYYEGHALSYSNQGVMIYRINGVGGTSIVSCGNAVTPSSEEIGRIGIDLTGEFPEAKKESSVRDGGLVIGKASQRIMHEANKLGYSMIPMPKFSITGKCAGCGTCIVGCDYDSKWTSRECLKSMDKKNYDLITGFNVDKVVSKNGKAVGVEGRKGLVKKVFYGERIVLSAGGINTPIILQRSGVDAGRELFVDLYNVTYGYSGEYDQRRELSMSTVCSKFHKEDGFVFAPFVDNWFSFISSVKPQYRANVFKLGKLMGIMVKIGDESTGRVYVNGKVDKAPTEADSIKLKKGSGIARQILINCGCKPETIFVTNPCGAHPGGTAAIGKVVDKRLETQIKGLYVCDCSVLPFAPGLPPMLTLIALAKWFAKNITISEGS